MLGMGLCEGLSMVENELAKAVSTLTEVGETQHAVNVLIFGWVCMGDKNAL